LHAAFSDRQAAIIQDRLFEVFCWKLNTESTSFLGGLLEFLLVDALSGHEVMQLAGGHSFFAWIGSVRVRHSESRCEDQMKKRELVNRSKRLAITPVVVA
jgi:hypothetical protein